LELKGKMKISCCEKRKVAIEWGWLRRLSLFYCANEPTNTTLALLTI
jgi:hypothetical protein